MNPKVVNVHKTNPVQTDGSFYCRYIGTKIIIFTFLRKDKWPALPGRQADALDRRGGHAALNKYLQTRNIFKENTEQNIKRNIV